MKIGLIAHPASFNEKEPSGLGTSTNCVIRAMVEQHPDIEFEIFTKGEPMSLPDYKGGNWKLTALPNVFLWLDRHLPRSRGHDAFVFVSTPVMPLLFTPKNSIVVVRDFGYLHMKPNNFCHRLQNYSVHLVQRSALSRAAGIIAISNETKQQAMKHFDIPEGKIRVIYNGFTNATDKPEDRVEREIEGVREPFFAYLGVLKERKNIETALKAFAEFKKTDTGEYSFVLSGKNGGEYFEKLEKIVSDNNLEDSVIFTGFISEEESVYLYKHATLFVYVSLLEGFGKPPLEAMSYGTPSIISGEPPINEVSGPGGCLVDPRNPKGIAKAMTKIVKDELYRKNLIERGLRRAAEFTWDKTGVRYIEFVQALS